MIVYVSGVLFIIGFLLGVLFQDANLTGSGTLLATVKSEIVECEEKLPRNKNCKIIAIVVDGAGELE